jgi:pyruvate kinase
MINAGMDVARLNFSHGNHDEHQRRLDVIRQLSRETGHEVKILQDLEGLRIRIGTFKNRSRTSIALKEKQIVLLSKQEIDGDYETIPLDYPGPLHAINSGDFIYIDDGNIALKVVDVSEKFVRCEVVVSGEIKEHKGVNIPNANFPSQGLTEKDRHDIEFGIKNRVDFIAQSFVRDKQDIVRIRDIV